MAQVTAEQMFNRVRAQAGRIAELELINDALTSENAQLQQALNAARLEQRELDTKVVAGEISKNGKDRRAKARAASAD